MYYHFQTNVWSHDHVLVLLFQRKSLNLEKESLENKSNEKQQKLLDEVKAAKKKIDALIKVLWKSYKIAKDFSKSENLVKNIYIPNISEYFKIPQYKSFSE